MPKIRIIIAIILTAIVALLLFNKVVQGRPYFLQSCADAKTRHITNIPKSSPYYRDTLDRDHDGLACEG